MPRRKGPVALRAALYQGWFGLRFLLRNPEFRKDLGRVYNPKKKSVKRIKTQGSDPQDTPGEVQDWWGLMEKWDLAWVPTTWPEQGPGPLSEVVKKEEELLYREMIERQKHPDQQERFIFHLPVQAWDPDQVAWDTWIDENLEELEKNPNLVPPPYLKAPNRILMLRVDLQYPQDVLEEVIGLELKKAKRKWPIQNKNKQRGFGKPRHRLDKAGLQLEIFDQISESKSFADIAKQLNKPVSTVKSLYLAASRKIFGAVHKPQKKSVPLLDFNPETHTQECPICRSAQTFEKMCQLARTYACQDYKSQRECPSSKL